MTKKEKLKRDTENFMTNQEDYMTSFRRNVEVYAKENKLTLLDISEMADISYATLNSFLYGKSKDCNLFTAIKLAKAFQISLDELVGAGTLTETQKRDLNRMRNFPRRTRYLIHWLIKYHDDMLQKEKHTKQISVMVPEVRNETGMFFSNHYEFADISSYSDEIKSKVYLGLKLSSEIYMPKYAPGDILLIANDKVNKTYMDYVFIYYGRIYLAKRTQSENGQFNYMVQDGGFQVKEEEIDGVMGYVADIING